MKLHRTKTRCGSRGWRVALRLPRLDMYGYRLPDRVTGWSFDSLRGYRLR